MGKQPFGRLDVYGAAPSNRGKRVTGRLGPEVKSAGSDGPARIVNSEASADDPCAVVANLVRLIGSAASSKDSQPEDSKWRRRV